MRCHNQELFDAESLETQAMPLTTRRYTPSGRFSGNAPDTPGSEGPDQTLGSEVEQATVSRASAASEHPAATRRTAREDTWSPRRPCPSTFAVSPS